ncbi:MAG TPA: glycine cleavage system aminomethyltransferase GcvT [Allosphingosinicella sp.]|jgi:aminomethyltransferase
MSDPMSDNPEQPLPLDGWHRARGARMVPFAGYAMPIQYDGILAEHRWTRQSAGLFDVSHMGQMILSGAGMDGGMDAGLDAALESVLPADLSLLKDGRLRYSLLLGDEGGIIDDLMVTRRGDHFYMVVNGATKHGDIEHLRARLPESVRLEHLEAQALLALQGPKAVEVLARLAPGVDALTFMTGGSFELEGVPAWISRSGYTGEDGFEISIPADAAERVAERLAAEHEVRPIGLGARDSLRLEAGLPLYGHDLDAATTPIEADLGFAISKRRRLEGGFPGAARIQHELEHGAIRRRVGLAVLGRQPVREGAMVVDGEGNEVGTVTSGGFSPMLEAPIAMAYVPAAMAEAGAVRLAARGKIFEAKVVPMPFVPHRYHRKGAAR